MSRVNGDLCRKTVITSRYAMKTANSDGCGPNIHFRLLREILLTKCMRLHVNVNQKPPFGLLTQPLLRRLVLIKRIDWQLHMTVMQRNSIRSRVDVALLPQIRTWLFSPEMHSFNTNHIANAFVSLTAYHYQQKRNLFCIFLRFQPTSISNQNGKCATSVSTNTTLWLFCLSTD